MTQPLKLVLSATDQNTSAVLGKVTANVQRMSRTVKSETDKSAKQIGVLKGAFEGLNSSVGLLPGHLGRITAGFQRLSGASAGVKLAAGAVVAIGAGGALAIGTMVKAATEFDAQMRNVNSLVHLGEAGFQAMEKQVLSLSTTLPQSAATLAAGLYDITSSGFSGQQSLDLLKISATAASAGLTTTATSARAITTVLQSYGMQAGQASDVSDILFQTVNKGVISFDELANNLGDVVGIAATAHIGIDQVGSAIAAMTLAGQNGAAATNSLQNLLQKTIKPSVELDAALKGLGYRSGAQALETDGLRVVMDKLRVSTGGQITELLKLYPDIQAARGALALMANEGKNYASVAGDIESKDRRRGATQAALNEQMKGFGLQMQLAKNKVQALAIEGGTKLFPVLIDLLGAANTLGPVIGQGLLEGAHLLAPAWHSLVSAGGDLVDIAKNLWTDFGPLAVLLAKFTVGGAVIALTALAKAIEAVTGFAAGHTTEIVALATVIGVLLAGNAIKAAGGIIWMTRQIKTMAAVSIAASRASGAAGLAASMAMLISPAGLAAVGIGLTVAAIIHFNNESKKANKAAAEFATGVDAALGKLGKNVTSKGIKDARHDLLSLSNQAKNLERDFQSSSGAYKLFNQTKGDGIDKQLDSAAMAWVEFNKQSRIADGNVTALSEAYGLTGDQVRQLAAANGVSLVGGILEANAAFAKLRAENFSGKTAAQTTYDAALKTLNDELATAEDKANALKDALDALMGGQLGVNAATREYNQGLADMGKAIDDANSKIAKGARNFDLNTAAGRANSETVDKQAGSLRDLVLAQQANGATGAQLNKTWDAGAAAIRKSALAHGVSKAAVDAYLGSIKLVPGQVNTLLNLAGVDAAVAGVKKAEGALNGLPASKTVTVKVMAQDGLQSVRRNYDALTNKVVSVTVNAGSQHAMTANAHGNIWMESYANGGQRLPKSAMIAKNGANLVQWAEPGTGGEAFIPLAPSRRDRSTDLLETVANMFGYQLESFATGGTTKQARANAAAAKKAASAAAAAAKHAAAAAAKKHAAEAKVSSEVQRLSAPVALDVSFSLSGAVSALQQQAEQRAQNVGEIRSRRSKDPNDTGADYYRQPNLSLKDYLGSFKKQTAAAGQWGKDLSRIARIAGTGVSEQLRAMGESGRDLTHKLAVGSAADVKRVVAELKKLAPEAADALTLYKRELDKGTADTATFGKDLLTLINRGQAGLAGKLAEMGADQGGALAHAAAVSGAAALAGLGKSVAANAATTAPEFLDALKLAGILSSGGGKIGIQGLATRSGSSVADVYGLLTRYNTQVFAKLGVAMTQVNKDQTLIKSGKPISGMAYGGIMPDGANTVRFAERGTGGEAYIPLSKARRGRSTDILSEVAGRFGYELAATNRHRSSAYATAQPRSGSVRAQAGATVTVAPGAVQLSVTVPPGLSEGQATRIATQVTDKAMKTLAREIKTGYR